MDYYDSGFFMENAHVKDFWNDVYFHSQSEEVKTSYWFDAAKPNQLCWLSWFAEWAVPYLADEFSQLESKSRFLKAQSEKLPVPWLAMRVVVES